MHALRDQLGNPLHIRAIINSVEKRSISVAYVLVPHRPFWVTAKRWVPPCGKRVRPLIAQAFVGCLKRCLHTCDDFTKLNFLIDTSADVSILPHTEEESSAESRTKLFVVNGTSIASFGTKWRKINLGLKQAFEWEFVITKAPWLMLERIPRRHKSGFCTQKISHGVKHYNPRLPCLRSTLPFSPMINWTENCKYYVDDIEGSTGAWTTFEDDTAMPLWILNRNQRRKCVFGVPENE